MATVVIQKRKREKGMSYHVTYRDPLTGIKRHYKTCHRLRDAQLSANDLRAIIDNGRLPKKRITYRPLTFSEVAAEVEKELGEKLKLREYSQKTCTDYFYWLNSIVMVFGDKLVSELSEADILKYLNEIAVVHSKVTSNKRLQVLKMVMKKGVQMHALRHDPTLNLKKFSENANKRNRFLMPNELNALVTAAKEGRAKHYLPALILLGAEHGAAKQECLSLKWKHIEFDYNGIGLIQFYRNKNKRQRTHYLMPRTKAGLIKWRDHLIQKRGREHTRVVESDLVFCRIDGQPIKGFNKSFRQACNLAEIRDFRFHDLRHTFCTNLLLSGAGINDVRELIGHSDIRMTDRYTHSMLERKRYMQERLARYYAGK